jgi:hypothetical protein
MGTAAGVTNFCGRFATPIPASRSFHHLPYRMLVPRAPRPFRHNWSATARTSGAMSRREGEIVPERGLVVAALLALAGGAFAQQLAARERWPAKPIRMIVPFPPGSSRDLVVREEVDRWGKVIRVAAVKPG